MTRKSLLFVFSIAFALALASPTLLNSFNAKKPGWHVALFNPAQPDELAIALCCALAITLVALGSCKLAGYVNRTSAFLAATLFGSGLVAVVLVGTMFFMNLGHQYASQSFSEEWGTFIKYALQGFVVTNLCMALMGSWLGLLFRKTSSPGSSAMPELPIEVLSVAHRSRWNPLSWFRVEQTSAA